MGKSLALFSPPPCSHTHLPRRLSLPTQAYFHPELFAHTEFDRQNLSQALKQAKQDGDLGVRAHLNEAALDASEGKAYRMRTSLTRGSAARSERILRGKGFVGGSGKAGKLP
jgi:hypothetical protein